MSVSATAFHETVEAQGHLIDSHIMERIFDSVVQAGGRFEVEHFSIGKTNSDPSSLRLRIEAPDQEHMERLLNVLRHASHDRLVRLRRHEQVRTTNRQRRR